MKFETAVKIILSEEGGATITNDPKDPGGLTKYGISKRAHPDIDIERLTEEDAEEVYREYYWDSLRLEEIPPALRLIVFDCGVNQGTGTAARLLQATLGVNVDGIIGDQTIRFANSMGITRVIEVFAMARHLRYAMNPRFPRFGGGWTKRLLNITIKSMQELSKGN